MEQGSVQKLKINGTYRHVTNVHPENNEWVVVELNPAEGR